MKLYHIASITMGVVFSTHSLNCGEKPVFNAKDCYTQLCQDNAISEQAYRSAFSEAGELCGTTSWKKNGLHQEVPMAAIAKMRHNFSRGGLLRIGAGIGITFSAIGIYKGSEMMDKANRSSNYAAAFGGTFFGMGAFGAGCIVGVGSAVLWGVGTKMRRSATYWLGARQIGGPATKFEHTDVTLKTVTQFAARRYALPSVVDMQELNREAHG
jgi:hypothetical protein